MKRYCGIVRLLMVMGLGVTLVQGHQHEPFFIEQLVRYTKAPLTVQKELLMMPMKLDLVEQTVFQQCASLPPLFFEYPELVRSLSYYSLGSFPTPIVPLSTLAAHVDHEIKLFCKQDGLSGGINAHSERLFGGNKVRKLEYLLADALYRGARSVMTFGCAGSNHVTATAAYAQQLGLDCICMLKRQPNAQVVRRNLALMNHYGASIRYYPTVGLRNFGAVCAAVDYKQEVGETPYVIPTGGSCPLGIIGFVNAAFELKEQIAQGCMPEPDYIYVAAGSLGTAAGLLLGSKAAGLKSKIIAVAVEPGGPTYFEEGIKRLFRETNDVLQTLAPSFPRFELQHDEVMVRYTSAGSEYALFTPEGAASMELMRSTEGMLLDGTYTGKAFDGLLQDLRSGTMRGNVVLFWNTFCSDDYRDILKDFDYRVLPKGVQRYFTEDVQTLDQ
jgi:1-aminocyclopropane-1-carboxylate deaminase/D-cysteine desulfhydrase-like pyridoxal-dependent ACC family enzyme